MQRALHSAWHTAWALSEPWGPLELQGLRPDCRLRFHSSQFPSPEARLWARAAEPSPCALGFPVRATEERPHLEDVVARVIAVVADANLRAHVPAAEGTGTELQATDLQKHVGHCGEAIPLQPQVLEPLQPAEGSTARLSLGRKPHR